MQRTTIIAEAGVNHNGNLQTAKKLIDAAADSGADFVKFQTFSASEIVTPHAMKADYQIENSGGDETQLEMISKLELKKEWHQDLIEHAQRRNIGFLTTAFDFQSLDFIRSLNLHLIKIPSGEITNSPYLKRIASFKKPIIVSTGMANIDEIDAALAVLVSNGASLQDITVLHCTTEYPAPFHEVNLFAMQTLRERFNVKIGYSDHTQGITVPIAAVALGATVIEKHFTLDRGMPGPDHKASLEPEELTAMIKSIREIEVSLGDGVKVATPSEEKNKIAARKSIVARRNISKGEIFDETNLTCKRPGNGLTPMLWDKIIGSAASKSFEKDELIVI